MALSPETIEIRKHGENLRRRETSPTPEDLEEMKAEAADEESYFRENPDLFKSK